MELVTPLLCGKMPFVFSKDTFGQYLYVPFVPPLHTIILSDSLYNNPLPSHLLDLRRRIAIPSQPIVEI